jgi:hypothetical protein
MFAFNHMAAQAVALQLEEAGTGVLRRQCSLIDILVVFTRD